MFESSVVKGWVLLAQWITILIWRIHKKCQHFSVVQHGGVSLNWGSNPSVKPWDAENVWIWQFGPGWGTPHINCVLNPQTCPLVHLVIGWVTWRFEIPTLVGSCWIYSRTRVPHCVWNIWGWDGSQDQLNLTSSIYFMGCWMDYAHAPFFHIYCIGPISQLAKNSSLLVGDQ